MESPLPDLSLSILIFENMVRDPNPANLLGSEEGVLAIHLAPYILRPRTTKTKSPLPFLSPSILKYENSGMRFNSNEPSSRDNNRERQEKGANTDRG